MGMFGSVELLSMLCAVVRTKVVAVCIGTVGVGLLGLYSTAIELLSSLVQLGLRTTAVRDIASAKPDVRPHMIAVVRRYSLILSLAGVVLALLLAPLLSLFTFSDFAHTSAFVLLSLAIGANTVVAGRAAELQGEGRLKSIARASVWSALVALLLVIPLVVIWHIDSILYLLLVYSGASLVAYIVASRRPERLPSVSRGSLRSHVAPMMRLGAYLTLSGAATWLAGYVVMSCLNHLGGSQVMGLYQAGYTLTVKYVGIVFTALSLEYFPRLTAALSSAPRRGQTMLRHETLLCVCVIAALASVMVPVAPWIVRLLYSDGFIRVVPMVVLGAPGLVMRAVSWAMAYVLVGSGRGRLFLFTEFSSSVICIISMLSGYWLCGMAGLGAGFTLWYSLYALIVWLLTRTRLHVTLGAHVWRIGWCAVISVAIVSAVAHVLSGSVAMVVGLVSAVVWLVVLKKMK